MDEISKPWIGLRENLPKNTHMYIYIDFPMKYEGFNHGCPVFFPPTAKICHPQGSTPQALTAMIMTPPLERPMACNDVFSFFVVTNHTPYANHGAGIFTLWKMAIYSGFTH